MEVHDDTKNEFVISDDQNTENVVPYDYLVKDSPQELPHDTSQHFTNFCQNSELDRLLPIPNTVNDNRG